MKVFKMMGLTLAASSMAFSLSQVAHAEQMVNGDNHASSYNNQVTQDQGEFVHNGNAGENASYLTSENFINALDSGQLNFNG